MIRALNDVTSWLESQSPENIESEIPNLPIQIIMDNGLYPHQARLLADAIKMFNNFHDTKKNLFYLNLFLQRLADPNSPLILSKSMRGTDKSLFLFDKVLTNKDLLRMIMSWVKNKTKYKTKNNNLPKYRTIISKSLDDDKDRPKLTLDTQDLNMDFILPALRPKTKHLGWKMGNSSIKNCRVIRYSQQPNGRISILPTLINSISNGNYSLLSKKFLIKKDDLQYPIYERSTAYNIMLVLDTSKSISWIIPHMEKLINHLISDISHTKDKLGLITFNNDLAKIYHYPTLNVKQVIGSINKLILKGQTPLGEGLELAVQVFSKEQYKLPGVNNIIVLVSDCFPEPLEGGHKDLLNEPSYKMVLKVAKKIKNEKIGFIIINPSEDTISKGSWNKKLIDEVLSVVDARYIDLHPIIKYNILNKKNVSFGDSQLTELSNSLFDMKSQAKLT